MDSGAGGGWGCEYLVPAHPELTCVTCKMLKYPIPDVFIFENAQTYMSQSLD